MTESHLTISVVVPTYNRAHLVCEAVDSLLAQTRIPDEIIVVDDGSTDDTQEKLRHYQLPVRVLYRDNGGLSAARNTGLAAATGDLIAFLDDDDTLPPTSIDQRAKLLEAYPEFAVVYGDALLIDFEGNEIGRYSTIRPGERPSGNVFAAFARYNQSPVHTFMFRHACLEANDRFDESLNTLEDYDFWLRLAAKNRFRYIDEVLAFYRTHNNMMTVTYPERMRLNQLKVQMRAINMAAFQEIQPHEQALVYRSVGAAQIILGQKIEARIWLRKAIQLWPTHWKAYLLLVVSLFDKDVIMKMLQVRGKLRALMKKNIRWVYNR